MDLTLYLGAVLVVAAVGLLFWAVTGAGAPKQARNAAVAAGAAVGDLRQVVLRQRAHKRILGPVMRSLGEKGKRLTPSGALTNLERKIDLAGARATWSVERLLATKLVLGSVGAVIGVLNVFDEVTLGGVVLLATLVGGGWMLPDFMLSRRATERQRNVNYELPDLLDQMTVSVEAGLGFEAAMTRVAQQNTGPLAQELARVLQDIRFGVPRKDAMQRLLTRTDSPDLRHFIAALTHADRLGMPLADVLRIQSSEMRKKRRLRAEEQALKIPVKLIFPLMLCIMPALFVVIIGPAIIRVVNNGGFS